MFSSVKAWDFHVKFLRLCGIITKWNAFFFYHYLNFFYSTMNILSDITHFNCEINKCFLEEQVKTQTVSCPSWRARGLEDCYGNRLPRATGHFRSARGGKGWPKTHSGAAKGEVGRTQSAKTEKLKKQPLRGFLLLLSWSEEPRGLRGRACSLLRWN